MEVYILDDRLRRTEVIDRFESLIWTERFSEKGDFELLLPSTNESRSLLVEGAHLALNESTRVMTVETIEDDVDQEGKAALKATGNSLEWMMDDRVATDGFVGLTENPKWIIGGTPGYICRFIFNKICVEGFIDPGDKIPFYTPGSIYPTSTINEPEEYVTLELDVASVYTIIKQICDMYGLGFRLVRNRDLSELHFDVYAGNDKTSFQSRNAPVIFSPGLNNLKSSKKMASIAKYKNVAYVFSKNGAEMVYADEAGFGTEGFDRKVMTVKADNIDDTIVGADLKALLIQKGKEALAENRRLLAFDGEISQYSDYKYGVDYELGDLVEMRDVDGSTNKMRVTEQIFVSDSEGDRSYPTLSTELYISAGTWLAMDKSLTWDDLGELTWDEL